MSEAPQSSWDQNIRRTQAPDPKVPQADVTSWSPAKHEGVETTIAGSKGSSATSTGAGGSNAIVGTGLNDWQGEQQQHMELRGTCLFVYPQAGPNAAQQQVAQGDGSMVTRNNPIYSKMTPGSIDPSEGNVFHLTLDSDVTIAIDWSKFDTMAGTIGQGNILKSFSPFCTIVIFHDGHKVTVPTQVFWDSGKAPDLSTPTGQVHVLNFFACRFNRGDGSAPVNQVFGGQWMVNGDLV